MTEKSFSGAVVDLLGDTVTNKRTNDKPEAAALCEVLKALRARPDQTLFLARINQAGGAGVHCPQLP